MNRKYVPAGSLLAVLLITVAPRLQGQAAAAPGAATPPDEETVVLSPFVVDASEDADTYRAEATLAGTRIRTDLRDVGSAIQVVTKRFLEDTGATSSQDLLVYTTSTEVGGQGGNFAGGGNGANINTDNARNSPQTNTRVRGLTNADNTRDFFLTDVPWDSYNVGRVDLQRGPNSILFGIGSPAGVVNSSLNAASFSDSNAVEFRFGSFGTTRTSADFNKVILEDQLAVRLSLLNDETRFRQEPAFSHDQRAYGAVRFDPKFLNKNGITTSFRVNYEDGSINANRPRITPPQDFITPWFRTGTYNAALFPGRAISESAKRTYNATQMGQPSDADLLANPFYGANWNATSDTSAPNANWNPWIGRIGGQIFDEPTAVFDRPEIGVPSGLFESSRPGSAYNTPFLALPGWATSVGIVPYNDWARQIGLPGSLIGAVKNFTLTDANIFDFYNQLIDGPNKSETQDFRAYNLAVDQTYFNQKVGFQAAYDDQHYQRATSKLIGRDIVGVDIMNTLPNGRYNFNVGRPFVVGGSNNGNNEGITDREAVRVTAFGELNFADILNESGLGKFLGRHVFTGLWSNQSARTFNRSWYAYNMDLLWRPRYNNNAAVVGVDARRINTLHYLGDSLATLGSASEAHIQSIKTFQSIPNRANIVRFNQNLRDGVTTPTSWASLVGYENYAAGILNGRDGGDRDSLTNSATEDLDETESRALVWQGFIWDGTIVPTVGFRKDTQDHFTRGNVPKNPQTNIALIHDPSWVMGETPLNTESGDSTSWSVVVHTPKALRDKLPVNLSVFYNESDNFEPKAGRVDIFNEPIASPIGDTKDYGVTISAFNDRVTLKINKYKTNVVRAGLDGAPTGVLESVYRLGANEAWGYSFGAWSDQARRGNRISGSGFQNDWNLLVPDQPLSATNTRIDPTIGFLGYQPLRGQSIAAAFTQWNAALDDFFNPAKAPSDRFVQAWQLNTRGPVAGRPQYDPTIGWAAGTAYYQAPAGLSVIGDTSSEGTEYELMAQPVRNWNISINAAKTDATRSGLAASFAEWVDSRNLFYQGPAGDIRMWNSSNSQQTLRGVWNSEFYASYLLYRKQEGGSVPELRPWRFNAVTNYDFSTGRLKGASVGGAVRWQDKIVVGYPLLPDPDGAGPELESFDLARPYYGPTESTFDLWVGYRKKLFEKVDWRLQLNIRNVFANKDLIPITVQPDGTPAASRIPEPRTWTITNSFKF